MSVRAIKKRENQLNNNAATRQSLFKKSPTSPQQRRTTVGSTFKAPSTLSSLHLLQQQHTLLGRNTRSCPELRHPSDTLERFSHLVRTKSESDVRTLLKSCTGNAADTAGRGLIGAKSEVCLQTISSHNYANEPVVKHQQQQEQQQQHIAEQLRPENHQQKQQIHPSQSLSMSEKMLSGARSNRDLLSQSAYVGNRNSAVSPTRRRMSECSYNSSVNYSQRSSAMSSSAYTLSSTAPDSNTVVRVPIIGYEVMEERARFTVYKLRVENPQTNDCWLVLRRYTDFVRLNNKLKQAFPHIALLLPRKKIFGDNFNSVFLDNRVQGLQIFVNSIMAKEELRKCKMVREFLCLDEPPSYSESMEECRAIFEAQEETIAHLKMQINSKNDLILNLQQKLRDEMSEKEQLEEAIKNMPAQCARCAVTTSGSTN